MAMPDRPADTYQIAEHHLADCDIAGVSALLADASRAAILAALLDGRALPAGELARCAGVTPATASVHLAKLTDGGILAVERQGRHRYFRIADPAVAHALEALAIIARPRRAATVKEAHVATGVRFARSCYDHLAGRLGILIADALVGHGALVLDARGWTFGNAAQDRFAAIGVDLATIAARAHAARRPLSRVCLDWSERRPHVAGLLGNALLCALLERGWLVRLPAGRALRVTNEGRRGLRKELGIVLF